MFSSLNLLGEPLTWVFKPSMVTFSSSKALTIIGNIKNKNNNNLQLNSSIKSNPTSTGNFFYTTVLSFSETPLHSLQSQFHIISFLQILPPHYLSWSHRTALLTCPILLLNISKLPFIFPFFLPSTDNRIGSRANHSACDTDLTQFIFLKYHTNYHWLDSSLSPSPLILPHFSYKQATVSLPIL